MKYNPLKDAYDDVTPQQGDHDVASVKTTLTPQHTQAAQDLSSQDGNLFKAEDIGEGYRLAGSTDIENVETVYIPDYKGRMREAKICPDLSESAETVSSSAPSRQQGSVQNSVQPTTLQHS